MSLLAWGFVNQTFAEDSIRDEAYPVVNEVIPEFQGFHLLSKQYVLGNIQLRPGMNYSHGLVDRSIRTLYSTGHFEFVEVVLEEADDGKVDVIFRLISKYTIKEIQFNDNEAYSDDRLASKSELEVDVPLNEYKVSLGAEKIAEYYIEKGFPHVEVNYRIQRNDQTGHAIVNYDIDEGQKVCIARIQFEGNEAFSGKKLRKQMKTREHSWISWITGSGKLDKSQFEEDLNTLRKFYQDSGYSDCTIEESKISMNPGSGNKISIIIPVTEGRVYYLGEFSIENASIYTESELLSLVALKPGEPFSPEALKEAASAIESHYISNGYLETAVKVERVPDVETGRIRVVFRIHESEKFYVESINLEGNTTTRSRVIVRELALSPGDVFDRNRMEVSQRRLQNTSYFENVRLSPGSTNVPGRKDLNITVSEGRTGSFTFGAGFGSVESAVVFFELSQGNFDLFNWRSGFRGDGQKFRLRTSLGTDSNQVLMAFEEPWLFEQRLAFGVELYRTESDFNSAIYNELRTGFELYLRRQLFELVETRLSYRLEVVDIFDVERNLTGSSVVNDGVVLNDGVSDIIQAAEGEDLVSKVGLTFLRDNRETLIFTRKGSRSTLQFEYAGLGGDVNYYKIEGRTAWFFPTFDTLKQSFSVVARAGTVSPFGRSETVPFYDRFYLGGPETLRGFDFRDVASSQTDDGDEPVGGNTYSMVSFEYGFRISEPLGLVLFYDWGFVNENDFDFGASDYADNWGVGARIQLLGSPLKLDLGIPITDPSGRSGGTQFNFSFGTRF